MNTKNPTRQPSRLAPAALLTVLTVLTLISACGGDEEANPPATSAAVPNTPPATVLPPATTTPAPTVAPPSPSTTPPTATPVDEEAAKQAVIAAAENAWHVFNEAKLDPTNQAKVDAAVAAYTGSARTLVEELLSDLIASNHRSRTLESAPASVEVLTDSVEIDEARTTAIVEMCTLGSNTLVEVGGNPDGSDRVLDDSVTAYHERNTFELIDGAWLYAAGTDLMTFPRSRTCESQS